MTNSLSLNTRPVRSSRPVAESSRSAPSQGNEPSITPVETFTSSSPKPTRTRFQRFASEAAYWGRKLALKLAEPAAALFGVGLGLSPARLTGANKLHKQGIDGSGVRVAILDQAFSQFGKGSEDVLGVYEAKSDTYKPGLEKAKVDIVREIVTKQKGMSFHGNAMANIITGESLGLTGVAPGAEIVGVSVLDEERKLTPEMFLKGLQWVADNHKEQNIKAISASVNYRNPSDEVRQKTQELVNKLKREGVALVVAAGNHGPRPDTVRFPADLENVVSVGALTQGVSSSPWDDRVERYSSRGGPNLPGPTLLAPGGDIFTKDNSGMVELTKGTSNSAPMVAAGIALLSQANPEASVDDKVGALCSTAQPLTGDPTIEGFGALRLEDAYLKVTSAPLDNQRIAE